MFSAPAYISKTLKFLFICAFNKKYGSDSNGRWYSAGFEAVEGSLCFPNHCKPALAPHDLLLGEYENVDSIRCFELYGCSTFTPFCVYFVSIYLYAALMSKSLKKLTFNSTCTIFE